MGDASGLAPAVDALKNLSKISTEATTTVTRTTQEWNTQLSRTNSGLQQQGQQVSNLSSLYKSLTATMSVIAIKQYTEVLQKNTDAVKESADNHEHLKDILHETISGTQELVNGLKAGAEMMGTLSGNAEEAERFTKGLSTAMTLLSQAEEVATAVQLALNLAMKENPAGLLATGLAAVIGLFAAYKSGADDAAEAQRVLNSTMKKTFDEYDETTEQAKEQHEMNMRDGQQKLELDQARRASLKTIKQDQTELNEEELRYNKERMNTLQMLNNSLAKTVEGFRGLEIGKDGVFNMDNLWVSIRMANDSINQLRAKNSQLGNSKEEEEQKRINNEKIEGLKKFKHAALAIDNEQKALHSKMQLDELNETKEADAKKLSSTVELNKKKAENNKAAAEKENAERKQRIAEEIAQNQKQDREEIQIQLIKNKTLLKGEKEYSTAYMQLKREEMQYKAQLELDEVTQSADSPELKAAKIGAIIEQLEEDLNKLDSQATKYQDQQQAKTGLHQIMNEGDNNIKKIKEDEAQADLDLTDKTEKEKLESKQSFMQRYHAAYVAELKSLEQWNILNKGKDKEADDEYAARKKELLQKMSETEIDIAEQTKKRKKELEEMALQEGKKAAMQALQEIADAAFENAAQQRQNELDGKLEHIQTLKEAELSNVNLTNNQKKAIEEKYRRQEAAAKKAAWEADRDAKAEQAIINGLLAFTTSLATQGYPVGLVTGLIALALAGVQAGIIASKTPPKFAKGVVGLQGPGTETSDSIPALLSRGESVITASATRRYEPILKQMNAGTYEPLPIPMLSTLPRLRDLSSMTATTQREPVIDYDKLGKAVAANVKLPAQYHQTLDANGFTTHILNKGNRVQLYNNRMEL